MQFTYTTGDRPLDGYTIKRGIDHGGFGEVYFAQSDGGKEVALKLVRRHLEVEQRGVGQCLNLKHPNLVTIFDVRHAPDGEYWIVMEFIHGQPLTELIAEHPTGLAADEARRLFELLCEAGAYLHDKGIVHRDLKPQNMFVEDGALKVGDYGLAKLITANRRSGQTESVGTVHYMAPELARGSYGKEIDIYAAGVILYEMLTGRVPFDGESVGEVLMKHLVAVPDLHALPPAYRPVVARALAKDPLHRYPSFQAMREDLAAHLAGKRDRAGELAATLPYVAPFQGRFSSSATESASLGDAPLREDLRQQLVPPAMGMVITGALSFLAPTIIFVQQLISEWDHLTRVETIIAWIFASLVCGAVGGVAAAVFVMAGLKMRKLAAYDFAVMSAIVAMISCPLSAGVGLLFGIWSLVVLRRPEVRRAFASKKDETEERTSDQVRAFAASLGSHSLRVALVVILIGSLISTAVALVVDSPWSSSQWPLVGHFLLVLLLGLLFSAMIAGIVYLVLSACGASRPAQGATRPASGTGAQDP